MEFQTLANLVSGYLGKKLLSGPPVEKVHERIQAFFDHFDHTASKSKGKTYVPAVRSLCT